VDPQSQFVIPLAEVSPSDESLVGAKAARLGALAKAGHPVAPGFCVTVQAYGLFLAESRLAGLIRMELDRKRFEDMRWEEIWDAALRIRSGFLAHPVPPEVAAAVATSTSVFPFGVVAAGEFAAVGWSSVAITDSISNWNGPAFLSARVKPIESTLAGFTGLNGSARPKA
jgi:hypothetical protein